jgi:nucleoside-diphosphate-sugar epimerase
MVVGATGFIGPAVVRRLLARGHEVVAASRAPRSGVFPLGVISVAMDRTNGAAVARVIEDHRPDAIVDLLALTLKDTQPFLAALEGTTGRYVLASSGDVYRQYDQLHRRHSGECLDQLPETAPLRARLFPYRTIPPRPPGSSEAWMDVYDKIPIEQAVAARTGRSWSIVRLPMIYGPGDRQGRFRWCIAPMLRGQTEITVDAEWARWRSTFGHVEDVADGLALAATHPKAERRIFNVGPKTALSQEEWAQRFAHAIGWSGRIIRVVRTTLPEVVAAGLDALDLACPLAMDTTKIRDRLGYAEVLSEEDALKTTIQEERRSLTDV